MFQRILKKKGQILNDVQSAMKVKTKEMQQHEEDKAVTVMAAVNLDSEPPTIIVPPRNGENIYQPSIQAITPGRSLTSSVLGKGPTENVYSLFKFGKRLGAGQFGTAYICQEISTGRMYACKTISRSTLISEEDVEDLRREVNILLFLRGQPNVVQLKGTYEDKTSVHIVMQLCEGGELFDEINNRIASRNVPYTEKDAAKIVVSMMSAVERCHSMGVMHRDLKPENFLLTTKDADADIVTADFGLATFFKPGESFSRVCGSPLYMAPEIIRIYQRQRGQNISRLRYGAEVDIWSAGVVIYILLSGMHPFSPSSGDRSEAGFLKRILRGNPSFSAREWQGVTPEVKALVKAMLDLDPKKRPTARQVLDHPWMKQAPNSPINASAMERFKTFLELVCVKRFRKQAVRILAKHFGDGELRELSRLLAKHSNQGGGQTSVETLLWGVASVGDHMEAVAELKEAAKQAGVASSSVFDHSEFFEATLQLAKIEQQENLYKAFSLFDQDLSGFITIQELTAACKQFRLSHRLVDELSREVNRNERGSLDYNEFVALMRKEAGGNSRKSVESALEDGSYREDSSNMML